MSSHEEGVAEPRGRRRAPRRPGQPYTVQEAADELRVSLETIYSACRRGELACLRFGTGGRGTIRIEESALAAFRDAARTGPATGEVALRHFKIRRR